EDRRSNQRGACEEVSRAGDQGPPEQASGEGLCTGAAGLFPRLHCQRRQYAGLRHIQFHGLSQKYRSLGPHQVILLASAQGLAKLLTSSICLSVKRRTSWR